MTVLEMLKEEFGKLPLKWCALKDGGEDIMRYFLEKAQPINHIVEIGTYRGISTILLSRYAEKVTTFDIVVNQPYIILDNANYYICQNEKKKNIIERLDFDFAFIDGDHREPGVRFDFECVKKCKRILFHDYFANNERPEINGSKPLIDELMKSGNWKVETKDIFAYAEYIGE